MGCANLRVPDSESSVANFLLYSVSLETNNCLSLFFFDLEEMISLFSNRINVFSVRWEGLHFLTSTNLFLKILRTFTLIHNDSILFSYRLSTSQLNAYLIKQTHCVSSPIRKFANKLYICFKTVLLSYLSNYSRS